MESSKEIPELLRMMFGEQAYPMRATAGERLMCWAEAFEAMNPLPNPPPEWGRDQRRGHQPAPPFFAIKLIRGWRYYSYE